MTSTDVLHSFYLPAFRIKQDVVPGMYSTLWFEADKEGEYQVFCTEYCGKSHSLMLAKLKVVSQEDFEQWLLDDPMKEYEGMDLAARGLKVMKKKACTACHYVDKNEAGVVGPSIVGQFGQKRKFTDGTEGVVDEAYIRQSIKEPAAKKQVGYENGVMSMIPVNEQEISWIIEYMKSTSNK
jgi:cytochrome c oxidase subunit 2